MEDWPVEVCGVTESIVTTQGPDERWNVAALGLQVESGGDSEGESATEQHVRARTWGRTRTWRNFRERGGGYVQFTRDAVDFVEAALAVREQSEPILDSADAWVRVTARRLDDGERGGTRWVDWELTPQVSAIDREVVPTTNRGYYAVVEATVAASRLDVETYDESVLRDRLEYFEDVVSRCGGPREREAIERLRELLE
jgi:hypothetical protein